VNSAVAAGVNGVGVSLVDPTAFNAPVAHALSSGIPVVAYNADVPTNPRLAYIGQDLFLSGQEMGAHIASLVPSGDVALFIATPGSLNIQPRINGALNTLKSYPSIKTHVVPTGAAIPAELTVISSYAQGHPSTKGMFAVDAGSTQGVAQTIQKQGLKGKVKGGGYDLLTPTIELLAAGYIDFTIDQQPYLQGFIPTLQLYMYRASQKLTGVADVDTGLKFLDPTSVVPYSKTKSRYEGSSTSAGVTSA
jgi:simple sugar transport system substrate-binding protein